MIKVAPLTDRYKEVFSKMFENYYKELGCTDDAPHLVEEYIIPDLLAGLIRADMLFEDGEPCGFVIYQIDDIDNDWNFKEGWGDIREIYVTPPYRKKGYGKFLLFTAEMKLKEGGADKCYLLPFERAEKFFLACGYKKTEEYCEDLDCNAYEKLDLDNGCKSCKK